MKMPLSQFSVFTGKPIYTTKNCLRLGLCPKPQWGRLLRFFVEGMGPRDGERVWQGSHGAKKG